MKQYIDSTYLKTPTQAGLDEIKNTQLVIELVQEAIEQGFKLVMIRPEMLHIAKRLLDEAKSTVGLGTVIDFPAGNSTIEIKLMEATQAIADGADELDFVCNYSAFIKGELAVVKEEVLKGTKLALDHGKVVKWIIEVAALTDTQIIQLTTLIREVVVSNCKAIDYDSVFVKSSTGFYQTENNLPNGATVQTITLMLANAYPLPVKAAGGVRTYQEAMNMIRLGVKRIGTSNAKAIVNDFKSNSEY